MMVKTFAEKRKDVTEEEILEYNAFCQLLPGPSSTQTVMLIAMKRGGIPLAIVTLLIWVLPAALVMGAFSYIVTYVDARNITASAFAFIQPMSLGFLAYAAAKMMKVSIQHPATYGIMFGAILVTTFFSSPWVFPLIMIVAGTVSNFSNKRIPTPQAKPKRINWINLWLFALVFAVAGVLSELARVNDWTNRRFFNIFENFYRFGSIVFGGGQALLPMMLYQFVKRPEHFGREPWLTSEALLTGYGFVQAVPGPVFSICTYVGGMVMAKEGLVAQAIGCLLGTIAVFLPSTLLLFFLFPLYQNLKQHVIIFRALEGIYAAVVGIVWASGIVLIRLTGVSLTNLLISAATFLMLSFTKLPAPLIVAAWMLAGWLSHTLG